MDKPDNLKCVRAVAYARTSTVLKQDPHLQIVAIREYAKRVGIEIVDEYVDQLSGTKSKRPGLDRLKRDMANRNFEIVIVSALDRLGRSTKDMLDLADSFVQAKVSLISLRENIALDTPSGRAFFAICSVVAQLDRDQIAERIKVALASKKIIAQQTNNGWRCGRPTKLTMELLNQIRALRANGTSIRKIAAQLGVSKGLVQRAIVGVPKGSDESGEKAE
jgi:DNA invertase Pin-like site-specific DNA recombinase